MPDHFYDHNLNLVTIGAHGWSGSCAPATAGWRGGRNLHWNKTFSVGCFQWLPSASRGIAKKGKCKVRVYGQRDNPRPVYEAADRICRELDAGTYAGPKTVRIKSHV